MQNGALSHPPPAPPPRVFTVAKPITAPRLAPTISSKCLSSAWCGRHLAFPVLTSTLRVNVETGQLYLIHSDLQQESCPRDAFARRVVVRQARGKEAELGTGALIWDVAILTAEMLVRTSLFGARVRRIPEESEEAVEVQSVFTGKTVLELGAGTGYTGLVAHTLGARLTILTDVAALMPTLRESNRLTAGKRKGSSSIRCEILEWSGDSTTAFLKRIEEEERQTASSVVPFAVDYVIVCECIVPRLYPIGPLVETLKAIADHSPKVKVLVGYEHRLYPYWDPRFVFTEMMRDVGGFRRSESFTETVMSELRQPEPRGPEDGPQVVPAEDMYLWEFTRATEM